VYSQKTTSPRAYRRKISIDRSKVLNTDHNDFPVLLSVVDPTLKSLAENGHIGREDGEDIYFTLPDLKTRLAHELAKYDPKKGELQAWIKIPELSCSKDTQLYLHYGDPSAATGRNADKVWDAQYRIVRHANDISSSAAVLPHSADLQLADALTVQAWVYCDTYQAESIQPLVSQWALPSSFGAFAAYDASSTDGLESIGYYGSVFDGRYVYFSPQRHHQDYTTVHAMVLRYDTHKDFKDPQSFAAYDAASTAGIDTKSYYGAAFDGKYIYFIPRHDGKVFHTRVLRYNTHMDFKNAESWDAYDVGIAHSHHAAVFDGRYLYLVPGYTGDVFKEDTLSGGVVRFDTQAALKDPQSWRFFDAKESLHAEAAGFVGGAFDGRYIYFVPFIKGVFLRYDTRGDFSSAENWQVYDAGPSHLEGYIGAVFDGTWLYFVPYGHSVIGRYNTRENFSAAASWQFYEAGHTAGLQTGGFAGGFFDGKYVYFEPFKKKSKDGEAFDFHTNLLRYDIQENFTAPGSWDAFDASRIDNLKTIGYQGGCFDGRYFYFAPLINLNDGNQKFFGTVLRYDTVGENGSFNLKYCDYGHNGGLCAAVPGPTFTINTLDGPLSVATHAPLAPGWHHLTGVYNGTTIKLFVDGVLLGERSGSGSIQTNQTDVVLGQFGATHFSGKIEEVRISNSARNDDWIKTEYQNLVDPLHFINVGEEEYSA